MSNTNPVVITPPQDIIAAIKGKVKIEDYIKKDIKDNSFSETKMVCACHSPFHQETTSSMYIFKNSQTFHDYGNGISGDIFQYVMERDHITLDKAVKKLATELDIPYIEPVRDTLLYDINREAAKFFHSNINKTVVNYIEARRFTKDTVDKYMLGYAGCNNNLIKELNSHGFTNEDIERTGLIRFDEQQNKYKNSYYGRLIIPIVDIDKNIVGFGGRVLDDSAPKYINTRDTEIFNKSETLYGLYECKECKPIILCEGYMDVLALKQAGYINSVASLGTALTHEQCKLLKCYTDEVYLCYDSDGPGRIATDKNIDSLGIVNIDAKVMDLSPEKDPDEYIKAGKDFKVKMREAKTPLEYELSQTDAAKHMDKIMKQLAKEILNQEK
jgi:DNA primase